MARDLNSKCKKCRRAGEKLFLKGDRCISPKCAMIRKPYPPGAHGKSISRNTSEYGKQLAMKQKIKRIYGILEKQFSLHFYEAQNKQGVTGDLLVARLEMRLDNAIYRIGLASSRSLARQLVRHGLISVNGKKVDIPSYEVGIGDKIGIKKGKLDKNYMKNQSILMKNKKDFPSWLKFDASKMEAEVTGIPNKVEAGGNIDAQLVVEFYSR